MTASTLTAPRRSERRFYVGLAVGLTLWCAFVGWVSYDFGFQLAQNQNQAQTQPVVIVIIHPAAQ